MIVRVDFYKLTGKWYSGGEVEIKPMPWEDGIIESLIENQDILIDTWWSSGTYYVVLSDIPESEKDRNYRYTYSRLYTPEAISNRLIQKGIFA